MKKASIFVSLFLLVNIVFCSKANAVVSELLDVYKVYGIEVDVTDVSATKARKKAMNNAVLEALETVFRRLVTRFDRPKLPEVSARKAQSLVQELTVKKEKNSSVRYIATLDIVFKADEINNLLSQNSIAFVQSKSKKVMLIPLYQEFVGAEPYFFEEENLWLKSFRETPPDSVIVPVTVPSKFSGFEEMVSKSELINGKLSNLDEIKNHFDVKDVFVATAVSFGGVEPRIEVQIKKLGKGYSESIPGLSVKQGDNKPISETFVEISQKIVEEIEESWKQNQVIRFDTMTKMIALIPTNSLQNWVRIRKILSNMSLISQFDLQAMKKDIAQVSISFSGSINRLVSEFEKKDLIVETNGNYWVIRDKDNYTRF